MADRRRHERFALAPALAGRLREQRVLVLDLGAFGARVECEAPLTPGEGGVLEIEDIAIDCTVARCDTIGAKQYSCGLTFTSEASPALKCFLRLDLVRPEIWCGGASFDAG